MARREPVQPRGEASRDKLLAAALELLAERGMAGISHRAVAERAGVSPGMTSYFFASRAELERAAIDKGYRERIADYEATTGALADAHASPGALADAAAELFTSSTLAMLLAHFEIFLNAARRPEIKEALDPVLESMRGLAEAAAAAAGIEDAPRFARALTAVIEGVELRRVAQGIDGRAEMAEALRLLAVGALAYQDDPDGWDQRLATEPTAGDARPDR